MCATRAPAGTHWPLLVLVTLYGVAVGVAQPFGDFPLNDDWSYVASAKTLALTGDWRPGGWTSMPLITQAVWAAPFCLVSNCTFEAFRASGIAAGLVLLVASYALFWQVTASRGAATFGAAAVAFNPINFALAFTFMTDTFFAMLLAVTSLLFLKAHRSGSAAMLALACLLAMAATLARQLALCVPLAYLALTIMTPGRTWRRVVGALLAVVLCVATLVMFERWLRATGRLPALYDVKSRELVTLLRDPAALLTTVSTNVVVVLLYFGLFSLPVLLVRGIPSRGAIPRAAALAVTVFAALAMWVKLGAMPASHNILIPQGIGPLTLRDTNVLGLPNVPPLPYWFWLVVSGLSLAGVFRLVECLVAWLMRLREASDPAIFAFACTLIYLAPLLPAGFFDRYLAALMPVVILFVLAATAPAIRTILPRRALAAAACAVFAIYAALGTHDYLSWNRARWQAITEVQQRDGANPATLDGGFEFNGGANYDSAYVRTPERSWWWVKDDTFLIASGPMPGYRTLRSYPYANYLPPGTRSVYVLQR